MPRMQELSTDLNAVYQGMSPSDSSTPTSADEWPWMSEPEHSTGTTPSSYFGVEGEAGWTAPGYGMNPLAVTS